MPRTFDEARAALDSVGEAQRALDARLASLKARIAAIHDLYERDAENLRRAALKGDP